MPVQALLLQIPVAYTRRSECSSELYGAKEREKQTYDHKHGAYGEDTVEAVENAAVTGEHLTVILDRILALYKRGDKIPDLREHGKNESAYAEDKVARVKLKEALDN